MLSLAAYISYQRDTYVILKQFIIIYRLLVETLYNMIKNACCVTKCYFLLSVV